MAEMEKSLMDLLQQHKRTHRDSAPPSGRVYMLTRPSTTLSRNHPDYVSADEEDPEDRSADPRSNRAVIQFLGDDHAGKEMARLATR